MKRSEEKEMTWNQTEEMYMERREFWMTKGYDKEDAGKLALDDVKQVKMYGVAETDLAK